ncbi:MAG: glycosyltransferase, partial [Desulfohalobiaceae bacterium]
VTGQNVEILPNPSIPEHIYEWAKANPNHPWLKQKSSPVILGMGRFTKRKDFSTLIRAFSMFLEKLQARLILVGDGEQKEHLQQLAAKLNIESYIHFPGFTKNPYAYMSRADLLVLSSTGAEGSPNVLKEALALGLPVVSTDCPSGPREILDDGRLGCLVPVQDPQAMSRAMLKTLREPTNPEHLRKAARKYSARSAAKSYLQELGLLS